MTTARTHSHQATARGFLRAVPSQNDVDEHAAGPREDNELTRKVADLPGLHPAALHGPLGKVLARIAPTTEAHPAGILVQLLALIGAMIGDGPHVVIGGSKHPARIWPLIVGRTGSGRKGESLAQARKFVSSFSSFGSYFVEHCLASGLSSGEGLVAHFQPPSNHDEARDRRLAVTEVEFARTLAASKRESSTLGPILRTLWEQDSAQVMTRSEPLKVTGIHLVVIAHITARELRMKLSDADMAGGTVNRFLPISVQQPKLLDDETDEPDTADLTAHLGSLVTHTHHAPARRYRRTSTAQAYWSRIYRALSDAEMEGPLGEVLARAPAYVLRLALLYAVLDEADDIGPNHLRAGLAVVNYAVHSAQHIFGDLAGTSDQNKLTNALQHAGDTGLTRAEISTLFGRNRQAAELDALLGDLVERGYIHTQRHQPERGRPTTIFSWTNQQPPDPIRELLDYPNVDLGRD